MKVYFLRRLLLVPVTLLGITMLVFVLMRAAPGGPVQRDLQEMMGAAASEQGGGSAMRESEGVAITPTQLFEIEEKHRRDKGIWRSYFEWLGVLPGRCSEQHGASSKARRRSQFKCRRLI